MLQDQPKNSVLSRIKSHISAGLTSRYLQVYLAILAVLFTLPSLKVGLVLDDYWHAVYMKKLPGVIPIQDSTLDMFRFIDGDPQRIAEVIDYGFLPWWTYEKIKGAFWRPLTCMTHWLDYQLWPDTPALMHAQNIFWFAALIIAITFYYRRMMGLIWLAGLAALLYTFDDAHGMPVGFIANRNAIIATFWGILTLISHDHWRRKGWSKGAIISPILLAISLLSAEAGIGTFAYLLAYAIFMERTGWQKRLVTLVPYVIVIVIWRIVWTQLGYGMEGIGIYVDPLDQPFVFLFSVVTKVPVYLLGQLALPPVDLLLILNSNKYLFIIYPLVILLFIFLFPLLRKDRLARFWAAGMLLATIPICAAMSSDRMLFFVGIGAMALLARFLVFVFEKPFVISQHVSIRISYKILAVLFIFIHLVIAPFGLMLRSAYPLGPPEYINQFFVRTPLDDSINQQDLILVNPPVPLICCYSPAIWVLQNQPIPRHFRMLSIGWYPVTLHRVDDRTITIRPKRGFLVGMAHADALMRDKNHPMTVGQKIHLTGMTVEVTELTSDQRPAEAIFRFDVPLEDKSLRWLYWHNGQFVPFTLPAIGQTIVLTTITND